jgi:arginase family enzyme
VSAEQIPLIIGGDCTITIGVVAGFIRKQPNLVPSSQVWLSPNSTRITMMPTARWPGD